MSKQLGGSRRRFLKSTLVSGIAAGVVPALSAARAFEPQRADPSNVPSFEYDESTVADLQAAMTSGKETARSLTEKYLARIDAIDKSGPAVNSVIEVNPDAVSIADDLDKERRAQKPRGPLHGIPVLIKDNIDTSDRMQTTAGSLALIGSKPVKDSFVAQRLRNPVRLF